MTREGIYPQNWPSQAHKPGHGRRATRVQPLLGLKIACRHPDRRQRRAVLVKLIDEMIRRDLKRGIAARCFVEVTP